MSSSKFRIYANHGAVPTGPARTNMTSHVCLALIPASEIAPADANAAPSAASVVAARPVLAEATLATPSALPEKPSPSALEGELIAIMDSPPEPGEPIASAFKRKEYKLGAIFAALTGSEAGAILNRFANPKDGDALALRFSRLVADRRARLMAFLADSQRREALSGRAS